MALAALLAGSALLVARLGPWGRGAGHPRPAAGLAGDPAAADPAAASAGGGATRGPDARPGPEGVEIARDEGARPAEPDADRRRASVTDQVVAIMTEFERQLDAAMARARESVVALEYTAGGGASGRRQATGVVINRQGEILSVRIDPPRGEPGARPGAARKGGAGAPARIVARDYLGRRHVAEWMAADPHTGLTLLRVSPRAVRPIRSAAEGPKLGSQVLVLGNPFGTGPSVNRGHIAGLDRVLELGPRQLGGLIQVQAPLYPGDSGAAVVDVRGGLLGVIRGGLGIPGTGRPGSGTSPRAAEPLVGADDPADGDPDTDFGFAIPTRDALWIAEQLRARGRVDRAYLGVQLEPMPISEVPAAAAEPKAPTPSPGPAGTWPGAVAAPTPTAPAATEPDSAPVPGDGARIREVVPGAPAERAGLRVGDRIVALDGQTIRSRNDLIDKLGLIPAGQAVVLGVVREGDPARPRFEVTVRTTSRSGQPGAGPVAGQGGPPRSRSSGAGVPVTPTASRDEPAAPAPAPPPSNGSNPVAAPSAAPTPSSEVRPGPDHGDAAAAPPSRGAAPAPVPPVPGRPDLVPPAPGAPASFDGLSHTLPRAVVERIEYLERRIDELEHVRGGAGSGMTVGPGDRDPRPEPGARDHSPEPSGRSPGASKP